MTLIVRGKHLETKPDFLVNNSKALLTSNCESNFDLVHNPRASRKVVSENDLGRKHPVHIPHSQVVCTQSKSYLFISS